MKLSRRLSALAAGLLSVAAQAAAPEPTGLWLDQTKRAGILIQPCGDRLCGTIAWLGEPNDPATGRPKTDARNPDPTLKTRPLCDLPLLNGFAAGDPGEWEHGTIYDPESGNTYRGFMVLRPDGTLKVRGFVGVSLFGRSQIWTRPPQPLARCG